jgi:Zn-dependent peptidase ImmA (M78 family)
VPTIEIPISGTVLAWALGEAGLTENHVADALGVAPQTVADWILEKSKPSKGQFDRLARLVGCQPSFLLLPEPPPASESLARLRTLSGGPQDQHEPAIEDLNAIKLARGFQRVARWILEQQPSPAPDLPPASIYGDPEAFAEHLHMWLGWTTSDQFGLEDYQVAKALRACIEAKGVIALALTMGTHGYRGFSLPDEKAPVIAVNTRDDIRARSISYIHELTHICIKNSSLCYQSPDTKIERWCDYVAGSFLAPRTELQRYVQVRLQVKQITNYEQVKQIANRFRISIRATAVRLDQIGLAAAGLYGMVNARASAEPRQAGGGGGGHTRAQLRMLRYGSAYVNQLLSAEEDGILKRADLVELLNISRGELQELRSIASQDAGG